MGRGVPSYRKSFISPTIAAPDSLNWIDRKKIRRRRLKERRLKKLYKELIIAIEDEPWYYEDLFVFLGDLPKIQATSEKNL